MPPTWDAAAARKWLAAGTRVLDGGTATELQSMGLDFAGDPLWGARALVDNRDTVVEAHMRFLRAGAAVITANSYQATVSTLRRVEPRRDADAVVASAVEAACGARGAFCAEAGVGEDAIAVAASVGPYACELCDASEYSGGYVDTVDAELIRQHHRRQLDAVLSSARRPDLVAFETVPALAEAVCIVHVLAERRRSGNAVPPAWISFSCKSDTAVSHGEPFADCVRRLAELNSQSNGELLCAVGVNCTEPRYVSGLLRAGKAAGGGVPLLAYPNRGLQYHGEGGWLAPAGAPQSGSPCADWLRCGWLHAWIDECGCSAVGGCCAVYSDDIKVLADYVKSRG